MSEREYVTIEKESYDVLLKKNADLIEESNRLKRVCECDSEEYFAKDVGNIFDIEPFDGDWKDSLICREEC